MTAPHQGFDPTRYLRKLGKGDYLEVKWRLVWLRTEHPDAEIETELSRWIESPPMAVFRARVTIPGGGSATGWGQEEPKDFGDYLEKAETKALGRALAALGYGTQFCDDHDYAGDNPDRVVDSPVNRGRGQSNQASRPAGNRAPARPAPARQQQAAPDAIDAAAAEAARMGAQPSRQPAPGGGQPNRPALPARESVMRQIFHLHRTAGDSDDVIKATLRERYGVAPMQLTEEQANAYLAELQGHVPPVRQEGQQAAQPAKPGNHSNQGATAPPAGAQRNSGQVAMISDALRGAIYAAGDAAGMTTDQVDNLCARTYNIHPRGLTLAQGNEFLKAIRATRRAG